MTTYTITTWTDLKGVKWAKCDGTLWSFTDYGALKTAHRAVARDMLSNGCDPTARVYFVNERGGKLGSVASLAELGRVR